MLLILQFRIATMRCFGEDGGVAISLVDEDFAVCVCFYRVMKAAKLRGGTLKFKPSRAPTSDQLL